MPGVLLGRKARAGKDAVQSENWDAAVYNYLELVAKDPENLEYRIGLRRARQKAANEHFQRGLTFREIGRLGEALMSFEMAIQLDPAHQYGAQMLAEVERPQPELLSLLGWAARPRRAEAEGAGGQGPAADPQPQS